MGHEPQDSLKDYLAKADVYVFPSQAEGCASSGKEAMAAGLPGITTRSGPITHSESGWIVPAKSVEKLANAIRTLAADSQLRQQLGVAAADRFANEWTWKSYARSVYEVYARLTI